MADDEQFSLCWNNFNSNLSAGFHESLCRGDLVDVTLAAEGQLVKAHRLVLSVCSPYFRKMFTQMPANQHAFVFLKDVSHTALKDLIQFMYCGEVNVKQEALPAFISTAEALQIKGLTDSDPPTSQSPAKPSTPAPQPSPIQQITSPRVRHRGSTSRSYNIESIDDSVEDSKQATQIVIQTTSPQKAQTTIVQQPQHQQQQQQQHHHQTQHYQPQQTATTVTTTNATHKRPAQRSSGVTSQTKRTKSTIDPLEATENAPSSQQITMQTVVADNKPAQQQNEAEFIDLPIELPTKSEPDYTEETGEEATAEQETTYVEDDSYGDMRYDESYFTENEEAANTAAAVVGGNISGAGGASTSKAIVKQQAFSDSSYAEASDQTNNEAQVFLKDVSHSALKDLIQFMYCGEVHVQKEALQTFIRTAESLQIKGLTDQNNMPTTQTPTKPSIPDPDICPIQQLPLSCGRHCSNLTLDPYNIKTYNSNENEQSSELLLPTPLKVVTFKSEPYAKQQQCQSQHINDKVIKKYGPNKNPAQRSIGDKFRSKRTRNAIGPLVSEPGTEFDIENNSETLDLPMKPEPDFMEDTTVQEATYNDIRYKDIILPANNANKIGSNVKGTSSDSIECSLNKIAKQEYNSNNSNVEVLNQESNIAVYSATSRGRVQLIYGGQPFIFEKNLKLPGGEEKKYWRCNQWWNQKCRSRVFTINDTVVPLNRYHTHEEIVKRKKRVRKIPPATTIPAKSCSTPGKKASSAPTTIDVTEMGMHLKYEEIVADVTEMVVTNDPLSKDVKK